MVVERKVNNGKSVLSKKLVLERGWTERERRNERREKGKRRE